MVSALLELGGGGEDTPEMLSELLQMGWAEAGTAGQGGAAEGRLSPFLCLCHICPQTRGP